MTNLWDKLGQYVTDAGGFAANAALESVRQDINKDLTGAGTKVQAGIFSGQVMEFLKNPVVWVLAIVVVVVIISKKR